MHISMTFDTSKLFQAFSKAPVQVARELRMANKIACREVATEAKQRHRFHSKSGQAERAIQVIVSSDGLVGRVFIDEGIAKHAIYQHEGTHHTKPIKPKHKKALYWVSGGAKFFSKGHKVGDIKPDKFLYRAAFRSRSYIRQAMRNAVKRAFIIAGLK